MCVVECDSFHVFCLFQIALDLRSEVKDQNTMMDDSVSESFYGHLVNISPHSCQTLSKIINNAISTVFIA